jgi:TRAP-type C4-dicarboxylate transport system substrate-binding protein
MTDKEFQNYLQTLPPELRALLLERAKAAATYVSKATQARTRIYAQFPEMNPKVVAVLSLVIARFS